MPRRIVVKLGSQLLCDESGELNLPVMERLAGQVGRLFENGWQVLLVSSGAVAAGQGADAIADPVARRQVLAATGQVRLMERYRALFAEAGITVAQVLASRQDFQTRGHYLNMRGCIEALLEAGILPVVNENDVVSVTELMFTDNDELAGLLAGMVKADLMCLLSTVPGVYDGDPAQHGVQVIFEWSDDVHRPETVVRAGTSALGRGGMHSKLNIARRAAGLGATVVIADGTEPGILEKIAAGEPVGTRFPAGNEASPTRRWLASADGFTSGSVTVNTGAAEALLDRSRLTSLLPVGVESVEGPFSQGDVIKVVGPDGRVLGCGRSAYGHEEAESLAGKRGGKPLIHYDYLYLVD